MSNLLQLRTEVLLGLAETSGATFTDIEVDNKINREYEFVQTELYMKNDEYFSKQVVASTTGIEDQAYAFPTDFVKLLSIEIQVNDLWYPVSKISIHRRNEFKSSSVWVTNTYKYFIIGDNYYIEPTPAVGTNNLRLVYIYTPDSLVDDTDIPQFPPAYHELLIIGAINRLRLALKEPPIDEDKYQMRLINLLDTVSPRVKHNPEQVRLVRGLY